MKVPKEKNRYCPHCKKHTKHKVELAKRRTLSTAHPLSRGGKYRAALRGRLGMGNQGKYSKPPGGGKMKGKKQTKKTDFRYECSICKKQHNQREGLRAKKVEFVTF